MAITSDGSLPKVGLAAIAFLFIGSLLIPAAGGFAQEQTIDINEMIVKAKSPADHEAIAAYYEHAAGDATTKAEIHDKMADSYSRYRPDYKPLPTHCRRIAKDFKDIAGEDAALAEAQRKMAKAAAR